MIHCHKLAPDQSNHPGWIRFCIEPKGHMAPCEYTAEPLIVLVRGPVQGKEVPTPLTYWATEYDPRTEAPTATLARVPRGVALPGDWKALSDAYYDVKSNKWATLAPLALDRVSANAAAELVPDATTRVVAVREIPEGGKWTVTLGFGKDSATWNMPGVYMSPEDARDHGIIAYQRYWAEEVKTVTTCRGGDPTWGEPFPIEPPQPIVIFPKRGQSTRGAYQDYLTANKPVEAPCAR